MTSSFQRRITALIKRIPRGRVATYGHIARLAGNPRGARHVVWALNSSSEKEKLPWHRVINSQGRISLKPGQGFELQKALLEDEGVRFDKNNKVDLDLYLWHPRKA